MPKELKVDIAGYVKPIPMGVLKVNNRKIGLGTIPAGESRVIPIPIRNIGDKVMAITKVVSKKQKTILYDSKKNGAIAVQAGATKTLTIQITLPDKKGRFMDSIMIHSDARNVTEKGYKVIVKAHIQ